MNLSRKIAAAALLAACGLSTTANAQALLNEIFFNPAATSGVSPSYSGSDADDHFEYIEIAGRPGMSLQGYAVAILIGGGSGTTKEVDESFIFQSGDALVDRAGDSLNVGFFTIYHNGGATAFASFVQGTNGCSALTLTQGNGFATMESRGTTANVSPFDGPGKLENDGSHTFVLLRRVDAANYNEWDKDENVEDATAGLITINMIDYQIVDEVAFGNDTGEEYDRYDNEISYTPSYIPDALIRVNYYTGENPERAVVQGLTPWAKTSVADESWVYGDTLGGAITCSSVAKYAFSIDTARYGSPTNYGQTNARTSLFFDTRFTVPSNYYLTPGTSNTLLTSGGTAPFRPRLGQFEFKTGDVNFDGLVDCVDRGLIQAAIAAGADLNEQLHDGSLSLNTNGDFRWQGPALNTLLAIAGQDGDELVEAADLTAFDTANCNLCDPSPSCPGGLSTSDVNGDGTVDVQDIFQIMNDAQ